MPHLLQLLLLAVIQGAAEMLPISSTAHVTIAAQLMHYERGSDYQWAFLLIMLHTGNMLSVLIYFRSRWSSLWKQWRELLLATLATLAVAGTIALALKHFWGLELEQLFNRIPLIAAALAAVGALILAAGLKDGKSPGRLAKIGYLPAAVIGIVQGFVPPFRGFSRSGSTISTGLFFGIERARAEEFSFALAVLLTPVVIAYEAKHLIGHASADPSAGFGPILLPSLLGMAFSFVAGLIALRFLSRWLERGRWQCFGIYCLIAAAILGVHFYLAR